MTKTAITFDQACARPCALQVAPSCGGPTLSGVDGYVCENCSVKLVELSARAATDDARCGYCGTIPAFRPARGEAICNRCAVNGLSQVRTWYERR